MATYSNILFFFFKLYIIVLVSPNIKMNPIFLPGKFHGQRSLAGNSPCGHKELDMTVATNTLSYQMSKVLYKL